MRNCTISTSGTLPYDLKQTGGTLADAGGNGGSGTDGALVTSGTVTSKQNRILNASGLDLVLPESGYNARQVLSLLLAACTGETSVASDGSDTFIFNFKAPDGSTTRIQATASALTRNRSSVTLTAPT